MAERPKSRETRVVQLVQSALEGQVDPASPLSALRAARPDFSGLDWAVLLLALEVELRIEIPERMGQAKRLSLRDFAKRVAALSPVERVSFTFERLQLLTEALLAVDE